MPLSREDYVEILRLLQSNLVERDPQAFEVVAGAFEQPRNPRRAVLHYLDLVEKVVSERSVGENARILALANRFIQTESGSPIQALTIQLSPQEQEIYRVESFDLARLPDRSEFMRGLRGLRNEILEDDGYRGENEGEFS